MSATFSIPTKINIRGRLWRVALAGAPHDEHHIHWRNVGIADAEKRLIVLARCQTEREIRSTFIHELLHACSSGKIPDAMEEKFVSDVEHRLLKALEQLNWTIAK